MSGFEALPLPDEDLQPLPLPDDVVEPLPLPENDFPLPTPSVDPAAASRAAMAANALRGRWLEELRSGAVKVGDLLTAAQGPDGAPLRRIRLTKLLAAVYGTGHAAQEERLERFLRVAAISPMPSPDERSRLDVAWLTDPRTGGTRLWSFADTISHDRSPAWAGFPFTPSEEGAS